MSFDTIRAAKHVLEMCSYEMQSSPTSPRPIWVLVVGCKDDYSRHFLECDRDFEINGLVNEALLHRRSVCRSTIDNSKPCNNHKFHKLRRPERLLEEKSDVSSSFGLLGRP